MLFVCMLQATIYAKAYEVSQLPIVVRVIPEWTNEYPTVINNWNGIFVSSVQGELPPILSVVTSINGCSTKGMSESSFNDILMKVEESKIEYLVKIEGENKKKECILHYHKSIYWAEGVKLSNPETISDNIQIQNLKNASAFNFNTFAFQLGYVEEIEEEKVLKSVATRLRNLGFKKTDDTDSADMILKLSKGRDNYNGYKLSLNILDRKVLTGGNERIIWTLDINGLKNDLKRHQNDIIRSFNDVCRYFPFDVPVYSNSITTLGIAFESKSAVPTGRTLMILPNSDAYNKGLRSGDAIIKAYVGGNTALYMTKTRRCYFKPNKKDGSKNWGIDFLAVFPIIPKYTINWAYDYLSLRRYDDQISKHHFRIRSKNGNKFTVDAPFEKQTIKFKYIR